MVQQAAFARQLGCRYQSGGINWNNWPSYKECLLTGVDLSSSHQSGGHSFSGSWSEKSEASMVRFDQSKVVDFVPTEVIREFPNVNALAITYSNVTVVKTGLLGNDLKKLEFLSFWDSKVQAIEAGAFTELENLKYILIMSSPLKILPFGLFRNNLKLEFARFGDNKISMIHPALFDDLTHLKLANFGSNVCVNRQFGCESCSVSKSGLKSGLSTCFANCQDDLECSNPALKEEILKSTKALKSEITSSIAQIDKKLTNLESTCETNFKNQSTKIKKVSDNLSLFIAKESNFMTDLQSLTTKNFEAKNFVIGNATKVLKDSNDLTMSDFKALFQDQVQKCEESNNETAESLNENLAGKIDVALESMKTANDDLKAAVENSNKETRKYLDSKVDSTIKSIEVANQKLLETLQETILKATDSKVELLDAKLVNTQMELEREKAKHIIEKKELEENFKQQMADFVQKQLKEFEKKLREESRP